MSNKSYFEGYYFKHRKGNNTVAFIPGSSEDTAFIQVITNDNSYNFNFPKIKFEKSILVGECAFSTSGISISLPNISGRIIYSDISPIKYDIMGPFRYFPLECRHGIISMHHNLYGELKIFGETINFDNGIGYIEKDSGRSFPSRYIWIQCNDFEEKCSIMISVAKIPFCGFNFDGCISIIMLGSQEYRFATYLGVKVKRNENTLILKQGKYTLIADINPVGSYPLSAPINGRMTETIRECNNAVGRFKFYEGNKQMFDLKSNNISYENYDKSHILY